ncbi:30S ribosomal protein S16 [Candidatus Woesebacteria bacterium RIFOXYA1_FULL_43_9]|uniref:Small ribosomal subunit protein bS16 n=1 Tax=Candidatus Woesebacteria bacterium RIFOXYA1_FULL_43_9 TaxID=1802534 RepID=A0A1F8CLV6_9BACT|nr:MAG: 30S ribosomal protein S16 [Candidatus Woesebacteria bacterium RIFOXYA1_FULL_43_9]
MLKIRMVRGGVANKPVFQIVVMEARSKNDGKALENLGIWSKIKNDFSANRERIDYWIKKGAQVSPSLKKLLEKK